VFVFANPAAPRNQIDIHAPDIALKSQIDELPADHPFRLTFKLIQKQLQIDRLPAAQVKVSSSIPISAGLGSGTAVTIALIRAFSVFLGRSLSPEEVSTMAFTVEKVYHGSPSGIDNTVIAYEKPVFFKKNNRPDFLNIATSWNFLIATSGVRSKTAEVVHAVQTKLRSKPDEINPLLEEIGKVTVKAKQTLINPRPDAKRLGRLMDQNHQLLKQLGVSSKILDHLVESAKQNGALGAKLSGAGVGGNIIALIEPDTRQPVEKALLRAGAEKVIFAAMPKGE